ncbi:RICIN domain-containing protein [Kitasatospora purpeofusca]|uniref:RICIN domain-containing protein n=1 Tax=Kitasatospora purpeofusca TaxID=67352 RepID=UPI00224D893A|nr:RICIN domain-containing protein [Kitasatospora purpeofusca]MCX4752121.1 RICIN domain-containing protein [Kitasatospora purpeofusca]WSR31718.1 RICIN domain-containing protein [Kitasatospora purpeofusca]WSR39742.1 RICIN domain-containing protein [Kitasatospora purpeofusca]
MRRIAVPFVTLLLAGAVTLVAPVAAAAAPPHSGVPSGAAAGDLPGPYIQGPLVGYLDKCVTARIHSLAYWYNALYYPCSGAADQVVKQAVGGTLEYKGLCMMPEPERWRRETPVVFDDCLGGSNEQWEFRDDGTIRNAWTNLCLDVPRASSQDGIRLILWDCVGGVNQRWRIAV